jgi:hypothetical protein
VLIGVKIMLDIVTIGKMTEYIPTSRTPFSKVKNIISELTKIYMTLVERLGRAYLNIDMNSFLFQTVFLKRKLFSFFRI